MRSTRLILSFSMSWKELLMRVGERNVEREALLTLLIIFLGGVTLQSFAAWPWNTDNASASSRIERLHWLALWWPAAPASVVAAWLCGWALSQPDPVRDPVGPFVLIACVPFGIVVVRAVARAVWSLARSPGDCGVATVGLFRPHIVFAPQLAKRLDERAIEAALAHERAHMRHRDPLRIWAAQFVTDLQWPWGSAQRRFTTWLATLEQARDDEARATGVDGADLAAALVASLRFQSTRRCAGGVGLIGQAEVVQARIARLLRPLPDAALPLDPSGKSIAALFALTLLFATLLGVACGERVIRPLLAVTS
jgi:Zn-dependent protease with chaperone function